MNRRTLIISAWAAAAIPACAREKPWRARLLEPSFDGKFYQSGLLIELQPNWKTYWRAPGDGGVPPSIEVKGANIKAFRFDCPVPQRIISETGENIGYHGEVCFPITIEPQDVHKALDIQLSAFFGVCETICVPAEFAETLSLKPVITPGADDIRMQRWLMKLPQATSDMMISATAKERILDLKLTRPAIDVFVECKDLPQIFAGKPQQQGEIAHMKIAGLKSGESLSGKSCRFTFATELGPLEQTLVVG